MFYLAGIIITFFLVVLLTGKPNKTAADKILVIWLCVIAFHLVLFYLFIIGKIYDYPALLGIPLPYPLLHGPFLYLYIAELTSQQPKKKTVRAVHFLPVIILYLVMIPFFKLPATEKINVYLHEGAGYETLTGICFYAIIISGIAYVTASMFLLYQYRKSIKKEFSNLEKINLAWLRYLVYGIAIIWVVVIFGNDTLVFGTAVLFVFHIGYFGIRQAGIFNNPLPHANPVQVEIKAGRIDCTPKLKYEKSCLDDKTAENIYNRLIDSMARKNIFEDPDLTLASLAKTLEVHPNHLSQVINTYEGKNFYDFINFYRVEQFKKLATQPGNRNYTLLSLAYDCGFNSKTSFNRNFKKIAGVSPTDFLNSL